MRLLVVGAGSTGGYFGGRLAAAGRDVTFLVRAGRAARLQADGLQIMSPHGNLTLNPKLVTASHITAPFDAILLAVKAYSLDAALDDFAPGVGPETMILPLMNGMKHVDLLRARFGYDALVGGVCRIAAVVDDKDRIVQLSRIHQIAYGEMNGAPSTRTEQLDAFMQGVGFDTDLSRTIEREMWEKWVMLATVGAVTCLMRGTTGEVEAAEGGSDFALQVLEEAVATVTAAGHTPSPGFVASTKALVTKENSAMTSSMYRDLQSGRPVEAGQILGDLVARARGAGVATPMLAAANTHLFVYQNRIESNQSAAI
jgi:2-dehydropantoate 2-reductase